MKKHLLLAALAFAFASPASAQTAPTADPHHGHNMHGQAGHAQHAQTQRSGQQGQHQGHNMQDGCCADRNNNGRMDCCENMPSGQSCCPQHQARPAQPQAQPNR